MSTVCIMHPFLLSITVSFTHSIFFNLFCEEIVEIFDVHKVVMTFDICNKYERNWPDGF